MSEQQSSSVGTIAWDNILNKLHTRINTRPDVNQGQGDETCETNNSAYTKHQQSLQTTYSHRTNNEYLHEFTKTRDTTGENYDSDIETTSDYPASHRSDFAENYRDFKPKFHQPSQKLRTKTNYKTETTEDIGAALIPTGHIVDRINFDRVLKTLPKDEKFRAPPSRESVFEGKPADLFGKLGSLAKNEVDKTAEI